MAMLPLFIRRASVCNISPPVKFRCDFTCANGTCVTPRILLLLCLTAGGCAWGYAGQESPKTQLPEQPKETVEVVKLKKTTPDTTEEQPQVTSPCGVDTFTIFKFDDETLVTKTVDCNDRKIIKSYQTSLTEPSETWQVLGYPKDRWYFLVDPRGESQEVITNAVLLRLSQEFNIEFYKRESKEGLLVYLFLDDLAAR